MRLRVVTVLWGAEFAHRFLQLGLRSLLAPGNLPEIARAHQVSYELHAPADDIRTMQADPAFAELARIAVVRSHVLRPRDIDTGNPMSHWLVWQSAVAAARRDDSYVILVAPDHIFCRGALARWVSLFEQGFLAVFSPGFQVVAETAADELAGRFPAPAPIDLSPADMHDVMFRHLHPIKIGMVSGSPRLNPHPEWHLRALPQGGFVQKVLASHAVAFHPGRIALTDNFCPTEQFDRVAFEPSWFLGAEPLLKYVGLQLRPARMDAAAVSHYGVWADTFIEAVNLRESDLTHTYARNAPSAPERRRQELAARFHAGQMHAGRAVIRIWRHLQEAGLYRAAQWLAAAHIHGRLRRRLLSRGPVTLFVPTDDVLDRIEGDEALRLLRGAETALRDVLRAHVAPGHQALAVGDGLAVGGAIAMLDGRSFARGSEATVRIVGGPWQADGVTLYAIDAPLVPVRLRTADRPGRAAAARRRLRHAGRRAVRSARDLVLALGRREPRVLRLLIWLRSRTRPEDGAGAARDAGAAPEGLVHYRRAMALRALVALRELFGFQAKDVLAAAGALPPLDRLPRVAGTASAAIASALADAVRCSPELGAAWLELGHLRMEAGDEDGAIEAFDRARAATDPSARMLASVEAAMILQRHGRHDETLAVLAAAGVPSMAPWRFHWLRARALTALGHADAALAAFERCLRWQPVETLAPAHLPRDLQALDDVAAEPGSE
jgi:tetratricopeptide (TPR) repeat protein